jgi:hypothetical protein
MGRLTILALRIVLAMVLAGSLFVQAVIVPLLATDLHEDFGPDVADVGVPLIVITVLGIVTIQVTVICVWRLVDDGAAGNSVLPCRLPVRRHRDRRRRDGHTSHLRTRRPSSHRGETVAPGVVLLIGGLAVIVAGIALIVLVMRMLLAQGGRRDAEAYHLQAELDEVI